MKNIFKKENLMPVIVLGTICLVVAALMAAVNTVTGPIIQKAEEQKVYDSLREVLDGEFSPLDLPENAPSTVNGLYEVKDEEGNLAGHVVTLEKQGYASKILLTVGIDKDGKITKVVITGQQETHGKDISPLINGLASVGADEVMDVEHVSNATKTSQYIKEAVADAFKVIGTDVNNGESDNTVDKDSLSKTDEEIKTLAKAMVGSDVDLTDVTPDDLTDVRRIYRAGESKGYVAYVFTVSSHYGTVDTENLIHIGTDGTIKNIQRLNWSVSDPAPDWGYNPPSEEKLNEFYSGLIGTNSASIGDVDLTTGATNTTTSLVNSVKEALTAVNKLISQDLPRPEAEIEALASNLAGNGELVKVTTGDSTLVRRLYRLASGNGYVAYLVAISPNYGTVETETLIHIDKNGNIASIEKLLWKVSDAVPEWGYNPPSEERVNQLYNDFVGKNLDTVNAVDLATGATSTGGRLLECVTKALEAVDSIAEPATDEAPAENTIVRTVGITLLSVMVVAIAACVILPKINRGGKDDE